MFFDHESSGYTKMVSSSSSPGHLNYSGIALSLLATDDFTFGEVGYISNDEIKKIKLTTVNDISNLLFICVDKFINKGNVGLFLIDGFIEHDNWTLTPYKKMKIANNLEGRWTQIDDEPIQFEIGLATSPNIFYFNSFNPASSSTGGSVVDPLVTPVANNFITNSYCTSANSDSYYRPTVLTNTPIYIIGDITITHTMYTIYKIENGSEVLVLNYGDIPGYLTSYAIPEDLVLDVGVQYYWKMRYKDNNSNYHGWSNIGTFKILQSYLTNLRITTPTNTVSPPVILNILFDVIGTVSCLSYRYQICSSDNTVLYDSNELGYTQPSIVLYSFSYQAGSTYNIKYCLKDSNDGWTEWSNRSSYSVNLGWEIFDGTKKSIVYTGITGTSIGNIECISLVPERLLVCNLKTIQEWAVSGNILVKNGTVCAEFSDIGSCLTFRKINTQYFACSYINTSNHLIFRVFSVAGIFMNHGSVDLCSDCTTTYITEISMFPLTLDNTKFCIVSQVSSGLKYWVVTVDPTNNYSVVHNTLALHNAGTNILPHNAANSETHWCTADYIDISKQQFAIIYRDRSAATAPRTCVDMYSMNLSTFVPTKLISSNPFKLDDTGDSWYDEIEYLADGYCLCSYADVGKAGYPTTLTMVKLTDTQILKSNSLVVNTNGYNPNCMVRVSDSIILQFNNTDRQIYVIKCNKDTMTITKNATVVQFSQFCSSIGTDSMNQPRRYMAACMITPNCVALVVTGNSYQSAYIELFSV